MLQIGTTTVTTIALAKVILYLYILATGIAIYKRAKPRVHLFLITLSVSVFYIVLAVPLKRMLFDNVGDENLILSLITQSLHGNPFRDFYYGWLPPFYPPLYFWLTGLAGRIINISSISAAKVGVTFTLILWFIAPYLMQRWYWKQELANKESIIATPWLWLSVPVLTFLMLDFGKIVTKPYEALSALLSLVLAGLLAEAMKRKEWKKYFYLFFGVLAGLLFLTFYFWWIILIPALCIMAIQSEDKKKNIFRIIVIGVCMLIIASPYILPLFSSYMQYGVENWQTRYFVIGDFASFFPWFGMSVQSVLALLGLAGLVYGWQKERFIKTAGLVLLLSYGYQAINILLYLGGIYPTQSSKGFLFLGTACLGVGAAYALVLVYSLAQKKLQPSQLKVACFIAFLIVVPLFPFGNFIDDPAIIQQVEKDLVLTDDSLAQAIQTNVSDYKTRTWLASDEPGFAPYLPLSYYIGYSPHFSHQAAQYSRRLAEVEALAQAPTAEAFMQLIAKGSPQPIDALVLYHDVAKDTYPIYLWADNYPNGGKESQIDILAELITEQYWKQVYSKDDWFIFIKR